MVKAVFTYKPESAYDDDPYVKYNFPKQYLSTVKASIDDIIIYYEPGRRGLGNVNRNGRQAYFAIARVSRVEPDQTKDEHHYAFVEDYLDFERPVPFRASSGTYERRLQKADGSVNKGLFGVNVRRLEDDEFAAICRAGFATGLERSMQGERRPSLGLREAAAVFEGPDSVARAFVERFVSRPFREVAFQKAVHEAYDRTCALTGLKVLNGGGRPEVEAAHIRPVASSGPDSVRNGMALSRTVHWMFDRGLVSIGEDLSILTTSKGLPDAVLRLLNPGRQVILPPDPALRPAPGFLAWHRQHVFKP